MINIYTQHRILSEVIDQPEALTEKQRATKLSFLLEENIGNFITQNPLLEDKSATESASSNIKPSIKPSDNLQQKMDNLRNFLANYSDNLTLRQKLFSDTPHPSDEAKRIQAKNEILEGFLVENHKLKYFPNDTDKPTIQNSPQFQLYEKYYNICAYRALVIENNFNSAEIQRRAYKMAVIFDEVGQVEKFTNSVASANTQNFDAQKPLASALSVEIPPCADYGITSYDLAKWKSLINPASQSDIRPSYALSLMMNASQIGKGSSFPKNFSEMKQEELRVTYPKYSQNPKMASIFLRYKKPNSTFEKALDMYESREVVENAPDNMPQIAIDLGEIDKKYNGKYFVKLPKGDYRGLILGDAIGCCQSIDNTCPIELITSGMNLANNCFYVLIESKNKKSDAFNYATTDWDNLEDNYKITAEGYAFKSKTNNFVFDSIETLEHVRDFPWTLILHKLMRQVKMIDPTIKAIKSGTGSTGKIRNFLPSYAQTNLEDPLEGAAFDAVKVIYNIANVDFDKFINFEDLKNLEANKIYLLASNSALACYNNKLFQFNDLKDLPSDKIKQLINIYSDAEISEKIKSLRDQRLISSANPLDFLIDRDLIKTMTTEAAENCYREGLIEFMDLKNYQPRIVEALISENSISCSKEGYCALTDLAKFNSKQMIEAITSPDTRKWFEFKDFENKNNDEILNLTSPLCFSYLQNYCGTPPSKDPRELVRSLVTKNDREIFRIIKEQDYSIIRSPSTEIIQKEWEKISSPPAIQSL